MKRIELSKQGKHKGKYFAIVDDDIFELIDSISWQILIGTKTVYAKARINNKTIFMHRFIIDCNENMIVDHINNNGLDNRSCNLRICTKTQKMMRVSRHSDSKHLFKGVVFHSKNRFAAHIQVEGKKINLGSFKTQIEAAKEYDKAAIKYFGEFANLNFK